MHHGMKRRQVSFGLVAQNVQHRMDGGGGQLKQGLPVLKYILSSQAG